jgi:hypothetical protein
VWDTWEGRDEEGGEMEVIEEVDEKL